MDTGDYATGTHFADGFVGVSRSQCSVSHRKTVSSCGRVYQTHCTDSFYTVHLQLLNASIT